MYTGVCACSDILSCLAQGPKYLIDFFCFHLDFGDRENPSPFLLKVSATFM